MATRGKDKRWFIAGVGCALVLGLGAGFTFSSASTLSSTFSSLGFISAQEALSTSSLVVLRSFGIGSMLFGLFGLVVVNSSSVLYTTSLAWTLYKYKLEGNNHYDEVLKDKIVLGAIPLQGSLNHLHRLSTPHLEGGVGITGVVCLLEQHEVKGDYFFQPVQPEEWKSKNVKFLWLKTQDYEPVDPKSLIEGADFIHEMVDKNGGKVYVHCKAGRGRSSACVVTYLVKYHNMTVDEAFKELKKNRKQIHLNSRQLKSVRDAAEIIKSKKD